MENSNILHPSLPKRSFSTSTSNGGGAHKSVYDDVFGGGGSAPKYGLHSLSPRLEDYAEIFGGFHAARSSFSIPFLDLPLHDSHLHLGRNFDYNKIFGGSRALPFTVSFQDLVRHLSSGGYDYDYDYDSSDEPWSPAQSGSLLDELDPLAGSDNSHRLSDGGSHQSVESNKPFNLSYNESSQRTMGTVLSESSRATSSGVVPGDKFSNYETSVPWNRVNEYCPVHATDEIDRSKEFGGRGGTEMKRYKKSVANPLYSNTQRNDLNPLQKHGESTCQQGKPFMTVSDISLRTKPSRLPPPSRPPPALVVNKEEYNGSDSKLKASKSCAFERVADDSSPLFFDVEVDASASAQGTENGHKIGKVICKGSKESIHSNWQSGDVVKVEGKTHNNVKVSSRFEDEKMLRIPRIETTVSASASKDTIRLEKSTEEASESQGVLYSNHIADSSAGAVVWTEATEYFEVVERNISREDHDQIVDRDNLMQRMNQDDHRHLKIMKSGAFDQKEDSKYFEVTKEAPRWDESRKQSQIGAEDFGLGNKQQINKASARLSNKKEFQDEEILSKLAFPCDSNSKIPETVQQLGGSEKIQIDHVEIGEGQPEAKAKVSEVEAKLEPKASKRMEVGKRFSDAQITNDNCKKHTENIVTEECNTRLTVEGTETRECVKKITEQGGTDEACGKENENEMSCKSKAVKEKNGDFYRTEVDNLRHRMTEIGAGRNGEVSDAEDNNHLSRDAGLLEEHSGHEEENETFEGDGYEREVKWDLESDVLIEGDQLKVLDGACKLDDVNAAKLRGEHDDYQMREATQAAFSSEGNEELQTESNSKNYEAGDGDPLVTGEFNKFCKNKDDLQDLDAHNETNNMAEPLSPPNKKTNSNIGDSGMGVSCVMEDRSATMTEYSHEPEKIIFTEDDGQRKIRGTQFIIDKSDIIYSLTPVQVSRESLVKGMKVDVSSVIEHSDDSLYLNKKATSQRLERKDKNVKENVTKIDQKVRERIRRETEMENEHMRKIEEEREREREREKDRMAVDRAALEARERSYAEARERAERAAVERATAEVRQRALAEARERLEKASMEARVRAERAAAERGIAEARQRAAVERATTEARQRAAGKSMADMAAFDSRERTEKFVSDRFSDSFRPSISRQSSFSSDLHNQISGVPNGLRYSYASAQVGAEGESPQRCKARLERYRRTAERAANALAEKNRRDLLAQREREERNRVAETLEAEVKRWSSGKEGNLRALLSTLQYILGPDSGWQPVPLTEVITSAAVKRAYRKATLCVHPDKLQQRGATVQQKYICEKVFDLLKESWNKFNSEER